MARLFLFLYTGIVFSVLSLVIAIDYFAAEFAYDVDSDDTVRTVSGYLHVLSVLRQHSSEAVTVDAMLEAARINGLIIAETPQDVITGHPRLSHLSDGQVVYLPSVFDQDIAYFKLPNSQQIFQLTPDQTTTGWKKQEQLELVTFYSLLLTTALVMGFFLWRLHRKLKIVESGALSLAQGNLDIRLATAAKYRVGSLNSSFNHMAEQIQTLVTSHKRLTSSVAHELRTPIFRIRLQLELLESQLHQAVTTSATTAYIRDIEEDLTDLDRLLDEMLTYARLERKDLPLTLTTIDLAQWLQTEHKNLTLYSRHPVSLAADISSTDDACHPRLQVDVLLLKRALANLIRNADRFAKDHIEISLEHTLQTPIQPLTQHLSIHLDDDGPGLPKDNPDRLLQPFERNGEVSNGYGLGLAIVKEIMARHSGHVRLSRSPLGGARVTLSFPLDN